MAVLGIEVATLVFPAVRYVKRTPKNYRERRSENTGTEASIMADRKKEFPREEPKGARRQLSADVRDRFHQLRQKAGLSRAELAVLSGVTEKTIYNIEHASSGRESFNEFTLEEIAKALGKKLPEILSSDMSEDAPLPVAENPRMDDSALLQFYSGATPLSVTIGEKSYTLPVELVLKPSATRIEEEPIKFRVTMDGFTPPPRIEPYVSAIRAQLADEMKINLHLYDRRVASLRGLRQVDGGWEGSLTKGSYFDALATNFRGMDLKPDKELFTLRELLSGRSRALEPLEGSALVNHLGFICIVESSDGKLVVQQRSGKVANRINTLSASVTGAIDFKDVQLALEANPGTESISLARLVSMAGLRETDSELGIDLSDLRFLGLVREFERGGKPELYFYGRSELALSGIANAREYRASERFKAKGLVGLPLHTLALEMGDQKSLDQFSDRLNGALQIAFTEGNLTLQVGLLLLARSLLFTQ